MTLLISLMVRLRSMTTLSDLVSSSENDILEIPSTFQHTIRPLRQWDVRLKYVRLGVFVKLILVVLIWNMHSWRDWEIVKYERLGHTWRKILMRSGLFQWKNTSQLLPVLVNWSDLQVPMTDCRKGGCDQLDSISGNWEKKEHLEFFPFDVLTFIGGDSIIETAMGSPYMLNGQFMLLFWIRTKDVYW